ncbi:MAG: hypothetical protein DRJ05_01320 [Bacteroidetes bacterium]|nr:MAG: hypothetical protein DRJ05_01320 [Bacteroidota bacterium]
MKKGFLPLGFLTLLIAGAAVFFLLTAANDNGKVKHINGQSIIKAKEWMAMVRNNQNTGLLDPRDVVKARNQASGQAIEKSSAEGELDWLEMGPGNMGGRTRALIVDNRDTSYNTLYAAGVNGGIFKSTNTGAFWERVNTPTLNVSCMVQDANGVIYVGTGEAFNNKDYSGIGEMGFVSGFVGQGLFKSDGSDSFSLVEGTVPTENNDTLEWAFINEIAITSNGALWAATNTGIMVNDGSGWGYAEANEVELTGIARDVEVHPNGIVVAAVNGLGYVSTSGSADGFVSFSTGEDHNLPSEGISRLQLTIAPSDDNIIYAMAAKSSNNSLENVYISEDRGQTWRVIGPGGSTSLNILGTGIVSSPYYQGDYNNVLEVFPNDPYHIIAGGINLWEGTKIAEDGFYDWVERSVSFAGALPFGILHPYYVHADHHVYAFRPGTNEFFLGTDGGVFKGIVGASYFEFQTLNKFFNISQFYTLDISNKLDEVIGGAQDIGTVFIGGNSSNLSNGIDLWNFGSDLVPEGSDGGYCAFSTIRKYETIIGETPPNIFYAKSPLPYDEILDLRMRRSNSMAFDYSSTFLDEGMSNSNFLTPMVLWESFSNENSRDSVDFIARQDYMAGDNIIVRSDTNMNFYPFDYTLPIDLSNGDTLRVQDINSARLFVATKEKIWMTNEAHNFAKEPEWFLISDDDNSGFIDNPQCIAHSADANYLFVGTQEGNLYRISNLALAYDFQRADVTSPNCIVATDIIEFVEGGSNQVITSISVDPLDGNKVLITLGNYGNAQYVYYSSNALSENPDFSSVQGNLPPMPVYASLLEMAEGDMAIIGTDQGIWVAEDISNPVWVQDLSGMGQIPVMAIKQQQTYKNSFTITIYDPVTNDPFYEIYEGIENTGVIYAATYGRGVFRAGEALVGIDDNEEFVEAPVNSLLDIYPNPVVHSANIKINLNESSDVEIRIFDMNGRIVQSVNKNDMQKGENSIQVNVSDLKKGTYVVRLIAGKTMGTSKFVIAK